MESKVGEVLVDQILGELSRHKDLGLDSMETSEESTDLTIQGFHKPGHRCREEIVLMSVIN